MLNKIQWDVLDHIIDGVSEPFEEVDSVIKKDNPKSSPGDTLNIIFDLFKLGLVEINQEPDPEFNQSFTNKKIIPKQPIDIIGDLKEHYTEYSKKRVYLWNFALDGDEIGVPFGIDIEITELGKEECEKECYKEYYPLD